MTRTTSNSSFDSFLSLMKRDQNPRRMRTGFAALCTKEAPEKYFESLLESELLDTVANPPKNKSDLLGEWPAGPYMVVIAERAKRVNDLELGRKILGVLRTVTSQSSSSSVRDNYQIWLDCARVAGHLPPSLLEPGDAKMIEVWLSSPYDRSLVALELSKGLVTNLLSERSNGAQALLLQIMDFFTQFRFVGHRRPVDDAVEVALEPYWLGEILKHQAKSLGASGKGGIDLLQGRLRALEGRSQKIPTWMARPAVEENPQNFQQDSLFDIFVAALRDAYVGYTERNGGNAADLIRSDLQDKSEIIRRIALHVLRACFPDQGNAASAITGTTFDGGTRHEMYLLLSERFDEFPPPIQQHLLEVIASLDTKNADRGTGSREHYWLTVLRSSRNSRVKKRLAALDAEYGALEADPHQGLLAWHESRHGSGPTPYSPAALRSLLEQHNLVELLNSFESVDHWKEGSVRSLVNALIEAVRDSPDLFLSSLDDFQQAKPAFQYGLIRGFAQAWENGRAAKVPGVGVEAWRCLLAFAIEVVSNRDVATDDPSVQPLTPQATWLPGAIAEWITGGVREDDYAFDLTELPLARGLLLSILAKLPSEASTKRVKDPVFSSINSPRGKVIEALLQLSLRARRSKQDDKGIEEVLEAFSLLLKTPKDLESHVLMAGALPQLHFLNHGWLNENINEILKPKTEEHLRWVLHGLAHSFASSWLHQLLRENEIYDRAFAIRGQLGQAWKSLLERMLIAILNGQEAPNSKFWTELIEQKDYASLVDAAWFVWTLRSRNTQPDEQSRLLAWWFYVGSRIDPQAELGVAVKGALGRLLWLLPAGDGQLATLLPEYAKYARQTHNEYEFVQQLVRVAAEQPKAAVAALQVVLDHGPPVIDHNHVYLNLLEILYAAGEVPAVVKAADMMRGIPEINALYQKMQGRAV